MGPNCSGIRTVMRAAVGFLDRGRRLAPRAGIFIGTDVVKFFPRRQIPVEAVAPGANTKSTASLLKSGRADQSQDNYILPSPLPLHKVWH